MLSLVLLELGAHRETTESSTRTRDDYEDEKLPSV